MLVETSSTLKNRFLNAFEKWKIWSETNKDKLKVLHLEKAHDRYQHKMDQQWTITHGINEQRIQIKSVNFVGSLKNTSHWNTLASTHSAHGWVCAHMTAPTCKQLIITFFHLLLYFIQFCTSQFLERCRQTMESQWEHDFKECWGMSLTEASQERFDQSTWSCCRTDWKES